MSAARASAEWLSSANVWNVDYIEQMYEQWLADRTSVAESWQVFFEGFALGRRLPTPSKGGSPASTTAAGQAAEAAPQAIVDQIKVFALIDQYRRYGHFLAKIDPLELPRPTPPDLSLASVGFQDSDLDRTFATGNFPGGAASNAQASLRDLLASLQDTYCGPIGAEYMHIENREIVRWLQAEMEPRRNRPSLSGPEKRDILKALLDAEMLETFVHTRYIGQKRFSLEGGDTLIPAVRAMAEIAPSLGIQEIVLGMAHRGRLNILANFLGMSYESIFSEFEGNFIPGSVYGDGDVKYHKGYTGDYKTRDGKIVHLSLTSNPSHLEAVNPIVEGRARAKQRQRGDTEQRKAVLPFLIHGDAAFAGQGLVAETLNLSQLPGYRTGGTLHIVVNNQIGFTTTPEEARSTPYATDVAKMIDAPIFHVNGDHPEAVVYVTQLALRFRQAFGRDVVIDLLCYRKHGHNEGDEPVFTQPLMYKKIKAHPPVRKLYAQALTQEGLLSEEQERGLAQDFESRLQQGLDHVRQTKKPIEIQAYNERWIGLDKPYSDQPVFTGISHDALLNVAKAYTTVPEGFHLIDKIARNLPLRYQAIEKKETVDWGWAEILAFGSLLAEGTPVRLSGQDCARGTFSHRHCVWQDLDKQTPYSPLNHIQPEQAKFCVYNSLLSEAAVLGFEFGYALAEPQMLILWEAQFGDFANGAQVIIDQFVIASQSKWQRTNGLVLLLPHGYEGQGPEHSNAYLERYLAACAEQNIQVCYVTSPAQYFHLLRRQMRRPFRRPLVVMSPKSLLRHPLMLSPVDDLLDGHFHEILDDPTPPATPERLILCTGKIYFDLLQKREKTSHPKAVILRVEQLYPFCQWRLDELLKKYPSVKDVAWVQEEPQNRGSWTYMLPILFENFVSLPILYVGREASASPATGSYKLHQVEQESIVDQALHAPTPPFRRSFQSLTV